MTGQDPTLPLELLAGLLALAGGYVVGSLPVAARLARAVEAWPVARGAGGASDRDPGGVAPASGAIAVWRAAGPGPGLLALAGEVAKGLLPVAIAVVTWSWGAGWAAGLGAVAGSRRPPRGPRRDRADAAVLAGACVGLSPVAGIIAVVVALVAGGVTRALGGRTGFAVLVAGPGAFAVLTLAGPGGPARAVAIAALVVVAAVRLPAARR